MTSPEHQLAELYVQMINTHDPNLVDRFVAADYVNHNAFVADGRDANRQFWTMFFAGLPDVSVTMEDLVISGDRVVGRFMGAGSYAPISQATAGASAALRDPRGRRLHHGEASRRTPFHRADVQQGAAR